MKNNQDFIQLLAKEGAKKALPSFKRIVTGIALILFGYYFFIAVLIFLSSSQIFLEYFLTIDSFLMASTGILALITAVKLMYPDRALSQVEKLLPFFPFVGLFMYFTYVTFSYNIDVLMSCLMMNDVMCFVKLLAVSLVPTVVGLFLLGKGFVIQSTLAGTHVILAIASFGYIILRIFESPLHPLQMFIWHYLPVVGLLFIGPLIGRILNPHN